MARETAKWMDQASFLTSGTAAAGKTVSVAHGFLRIGRMLAFIPFQGASECQLRSLPCSNRQKCRNA